MIVSFCHLHLGLLLAFLLAFAFSASDLNSDSKCLALGEVEVFRPVVVVHVSFSLNFFIQNAAVVFDQVAFFKKQTEHLKIMVSHQIQKVFLNFFIFFLREQDCEQVGVGVSSTHSCEVIF